MRDKHIANERKYATVFNKVLFLYFKNSVEFQSIRYRNISMDALRTGRGYHGTREVHYGNRCANQLGAFRLNV